MLKKVIKVLLIDDDELQYIIIEKLLEKIPSPQYKLDWACNYEEAMIAIETNQHDAYLVDYHLDACQGTTIIRNAINKGCTAPMILQTSDTHRSVDLEAMEAGAVDYLVKSQINGVLLERSIRYAIERKETERQLERQNSIIADHVQEAERTNHYLIQLTQRITQELEQARKTQRALLPAPPSIPGCLIATKYEPMEQIGGDFYDIFELNRHEIGLLVADVTGHGIPAALISFMVSSLFKTTAPKLQDIEETIFQVNNALEGKIPQDKFATTFYCIYNTHTNELTYSNMGHPPGYLIRPQTQEILELQSGGILLGILPIKRNQYKSSSVLLKPGDKVFLYTDGLIEMPNQSGNIFGRKKLEEFLLNHQHLPINDLIEEAYLYILTYSGAEAYTDDITLVGLELTDV
ncbi:MAG: SpoIIE family protein phosphatase [SAR324 cluster bacterium]|nr:SpoIIE family protein phosphatase [SAR324 cluster bacterium]